MALDRPTCFNDSLWPTLTTVISYCLHIEYSVVSEGSSNALVASSRTDCQTKKTNLITTENIYKKMLFFHGNYYAYGPWNLAQTKKLHANNKITASLPTNILSKQSSIPNVTNNKKETFFKKSFRLTSFSKPTISTCFNLLQVCLSVPTFVFAVSFLSFNVLSDYCYVSLNLVVVPTVRIFL